MPLRPFMRKNIDANCELFKPVPLTENIGMIEPIDQLPDCNPITYSNAVACSQDFEPKTMNNEGTFHIQSKLTGGYLTFDIHTEIVYANRSTIDPTYLQIGGLGWAPQNLGRHQYVVQKLTNVSVCKIYSKSDVLMLVNGKFSVSKNNPVTM